MALNPVLRMMLGDELADAVDAARERHGNEEVMASCDAGLWQLSVDGVVIAEGLTYEAAIEAADAVDPA